MTDTTMQLLSQGTDPVKMPDFDILAEGKTLSGVAERLMSLSLTDNRGFEADQLTITLDDADGQLQLPPRGARLTVLIGWKGEPLTTPTRPKKATCPSLRAWRKCWAQSPR